MQIAMLLCPELEQSSSPKDNMAVLTDIMSSSVSIYSFATQGLAEELTNTPALTPLSLI
jgi:hypothetical protein